MKFPRFGIARYRIALILLLAALVISGAAFYFFHLNSSLGKSRTLEILDTNSGKIYGRWPLEENEEFAIEFIHSVNQSPVKEFFGVENRTIRPKAVLFSSFGAGMLSDLEEGMSISQDGEAMVISGFNYSYKELNYIVGTVSDHLLFINGETVSLRDLCGRNAHITIRSR